MTNSLVQWSSPEVPGCTKHGVEGWSMGCVESQISVSGPLTISGIAQVGKLGQQLEDSLSSWWEVASRVSGRPVAALSKMSSQ